MLLSIVEPKVVEPSLLLAGEPLEPVAFCVTPVICADAVAADSMRTAAVPSHPSTHGLDAPATLWSAFARPRQVLLRASGLEFRNYTLGGPLPCARGLLSRKMVISLSRRPRAP